MPTFPALSIDPTFFSGYRLGRFLNFVGTIQRAGQSPSRGLAVDPATVLCVSDSGLATVYGSGDVYFAMSANAPELVDNAVGGANKVLQMSNVGINWYADGQEVQLGSAFAIAQSGQTGSVSTLNGNVVLSSGALPDKFIGIPKGS